MEDSRFEQFDIVTGKFYPHGMFIPPGLLSITERLTTWQVCWPIGSGPYKGEWAMLLIGEKTDSAPFMFVSSGHIAVTDVMPFSERKRGEPCLYPQSCRCPYMRE